MLKLRVNHDVCVYSQRLSQSWKGGLVSEGRGRRVISGRTGRRRWVELPGDINWLGESLSKH